ncbi:MAG: DNA polymerase III subunit delta [Gammaproteobacteria bacterium]|nr:DNA polymerase III subunit delta [Gammaproteobacteria bacterium]MBU1653951.1 DNA polymerase III subunit delta [Gammaproteobacteria bacterium]MBU1960155.1 DNA polymerase III subunit delta [Gammaproteobacteria bacterium]
MRLRADQLTARLGKQLDPVYLISGDEPLQLNECTDGVRRAAALNGYSDRTLLDVQSGFQWGDLAYEANNLSLFADRRLFDLRLKSSAIGAEGSKAIAGYCAAPPPDTLLLITAPKLERKQLTTKWIKAIEEIGVLVQIWPIAGDRLLPWLEQRMRNRGLAPEAGVVAMLAERVEGNLLAAAQEIDKLLLLKGPGILSAQALAQAVADSARFDVYDLVDRALLGEAPRCIRILAGLRGEGVAAPIVLWALARELRLLSTLAGAIGQGAPMETALARAGVWDKRKPIVSGALRRLPPAQIRGLLLLCRDADCQIKGVAPGNPWDLFERIVLGLGNLPLRLAA